MKKVILILSMGMVLVAGVFGTAAYATDSKGDSKSTTATTSPSGCPACPIKTDKSWYTY